MNEKLKKAAASTKNFVANHKTAIAVTATATVAVVLHRQVVKGWNEFLTENDLMDKFYNPEDN